MRVKRWWRRPVDVAAWTFLLCGLASASGCVYPRRSTSLTPVRAESASFGAPDNVWRLTVVEAQVRPRKSGDLAWDDGEGRPDVFVRVYVDGEQLFETETIDDSLTPRFEATLPRNVHIAPSAELRLEVWDRDTVGADPIGIHRTHGLPANAVPGAHARVMLERGSYLTVRVDAPQAHRGLGLSSYEVRPDSLLVREVLPHSPAGRAGLQPGDEIVAIGEQRVSDLEEARSASALSMAGQRSEALTVRGADGEERQVDLDRGFVWLTM